MPPTSNTVWLRGRKRKFRGWAKDWMGKARWTKTGRMTGVVRQAYLRWHEKPCSDDELLLVYGYKRNTKETVDDRPHFGVDKEGVVHQFLDTCFASPQAESLDVPYNGCVIIENIGQGETPTAAQVEGVRRILQACARYHTVMTVNHDPEWPEINAAR